MDEAFGTTGKTLRSDLVRAAVVGLGVAVVFTGAQAFPENPPCPTRELAPLGLAPVPNQCATADCLVLFKGYKWWTSYAYNKVEFFTNYGLGTPFAPNHVFLDGSTQNMVLKADNDVDLGGGKIWSGAEAVLMFDQNNNEANLGYGNYLVTAKLTMPAPHPSMPSILMWRSACSRTSVSALSRMNPQEGRWQTPGASWIWRRSHDGAMRQGRPAQFVAEMGSSTLVDF